jgi:Phosphotransferase enzyme family
VDGTEEWLRDAELVSDEPWATVHRVQLDGRVAWFKACKPLQAFEPRLTAVLSERWPDRVPEVIAHEDGAWLLLGDAGTPIGTFDPHVNPPEAWEAVLPPYAELQRGEIAHVAEHLAGGVPDLRTEILPLRYDELLARDLPLEPDEIARLRRFAPRFAELCADLASSGIPDSIQHDDLHQGNVYDHDGRLRVLDWGDSSISHPFVSLFETFRHLRRPDWCERLRDVYLEPWGSGLVDTFDLALRVGTIAHSIAWLRQYDSLPDELRPTFGIEGMLRLAVAQTDP